MVRPPALYEVHRFRSSGFDIVQQQIVHVACEIGKDPLAIGGRKRLVREGAFSDLLRFRESHAEIAELGARASGSTRA